MSKEIKAGYVYVLSNPAMPGLVKIGRSIYGGKKRAVDLYQTGVPEPFTLEFEAYLSDPASVEHDLHTNLDEYRINGSREFFRIPVSKAVFYVIDRIIADYEKILMDWDDQEAANQVYSLSNKMGISYRDTADLLDHLGESSVAEAYQKLTVEREDKRKPYILVPKPKGDI